MTFTTDGVDEDHIDGDEPNNFLDHWTYTIQTDATGLVVGGEWQDEKDHPDFAWIPYHNTTQRETGGSENPFLGYGDLLDVVGHELSGGKGLDMIRALHQWMLLVMLSACTGGCEISSGDTGGTTVSICLW